MDTAFALFDTITDNLGSIVTLAFALIGLLSQLAALFNLSGLAQVSTTLHDAVQFAAGNWGQAANAIKIVEVYRTAGPAAALSELAAMAAATRKDSGGIFPPGASPAALLAVVLVAGSLTACAPVSAKIDSLTGTTLAERCKLYRAGDLAIDGLATLFPELVGLAAVDDAAIKAVCGQPAAKP